MNKQKFIVHQSYLMNKQTIGVYHLCLMKHFKLHYQFPPYTLIEHMFAPPAKQFIGRRIKVYQVHTSQLKHKIHHQWGIEVYILVKT